MAHHVERTPALRTEVDAAPCASTYDRAVVASTVRSLLVSKRTYAPPLPVLEPAVTVGPFQVPYAVKGRSKRVTV